MMSAGAEPQAGPNPAGREAFRVTTRSPPAAVAPSLAGRWTITVMQLEGSVQKVSKLSTTLIMKSWRAHQLTSVNWCFQLEVVHEFKLHHDAVTCSYIHYMHYIFMSFCYIALHIVISY
jgi:hypothetical protein